MDAVDDNSDVKLYKASGDLLPELRTKLPLLVWSPSSKAPSQKCRKWVLFSKTEELIRLLNQFQEWPQLLDPHLPELMKHLIDSFLHYLTTSSEEYHRLPPKAGVDSALPLPRATCKLLYVFCKIRGFKVIVRFFNNEPKYIELLLANLHARQDVLAAGDAPKMIWEELYIMLAWLSHLMLTPFDLSSVSSTLLPNSGKTSIALEFDLPNIATSLLSLALRHLGQASKEREAASLLIVRLALRPDMQGLGLLQKMVHHVMETLGHVDLASQYPTLGLLSVLAGFMISGSDEDVAQIARKVFSFCYESATSDSAEALAIRNTAPARKLLIKTMRASLIHALSLSEKRSVYLPSEAVDSMVEDAIQFFLESLADKDTPVRMAASKALSQVTFRLDPSMASEVVQAVVDSFSENMLYEKPDRRGVIELQAITDITHQQMMELKPNYSAVDPLRWHGLMLSLGHLLFRRAPPPHQLSSTMRCLLSGLNFEQRSNTGTSIGTGVRDAACFGIWALSRKYTTSEVNAVDVNKLQVITANELVSEKRTSAVQLVATQLVVSASLDPSGNIRRACSAALQELIGRHPDIVDQGIPLIQIVDYNAVARRSHAMQEVAASATKLSATYHEGILVALLGWRAARGTDADSRRAAAESVGFLSDEYRIDQIIAVLEHIIRVLKTTKSANNATTAGVRHGLLLTMAALIRPRPNKQLLVPLPMALLIWQDIRKYAGSVGGRITKDLELVVEATAVLISSLARLFISKQLLGPNRLQQVPQTTLEMSLSMLHDFQGSTDNDAAVKACASATEDTFQLLSPDFKAQLVNLWLVDRASKRSGFNSKARIVTLGAIFDALIGKDAENDVDETGVLMSHYQQRIVKQLQDFVSEGWPIETKVAAVQSLRTVNKSLSFHLTEYDFESTLLVALTDYTIDQRGDVGANLRLEALMLTDLILYHVYHPSHHRHSLYSRDPKVQGLLIQVLQKVVKLAAEKLDKIRSQAWQCLQTFWELQKYPGYQTASSGPLHALLRSRANLKTGEVWQPVGVSSEKYFDQVLCLLDVEWLQGPVLQGIVSSAAAGTEDLGRAARAAIVSRLTGEHQDRRTDEYCTFLRVLTQYLRECASDDRAAVPTVELLAFIIDQCSTSSEDSASTQQAHNDLLATMQIVHLPSSSIARLEAAVQVYSSLIPHASTSKRTLDRLTRMLLHRYPAIRNTTAETLFLHTSTPTLVLVDWSQPATTLKPQVTAIRKAIGVS